MLKDQISVSLGGDDQKTQTECITAKSIKIFNNIRSENAKYLLSRQHKMSKNHIV